MAAQPSAASGEHARVGGIDMPKTERGLWWDMYRTGVLACLIIYWCTLFVATHTPFADFPEEMARKLPSDVNLHFWCYAGLAFWGALVVFSRVQGITCQFRACVWFLGVVIPVYGVLDEATQPIFNRSFQFKDIAFDMLGTGAVLAVVAGITWLRLRRARLSPTR